MTAVHIYGSALLACLLITPWVPFLLPVPIFELVSSRLGSTLPVVWAGIPTVVSVVAFVTLLPLLRAVVDTVDGRKRAKELTANEAEGRCPWCTSPFKKQTVYCRVCGLRMSPIQGSLIATKREALRLTFIVLCFLFPLAIVVWLFVAGLLQGGNLATFVSTLLAIIVALLGLWRIGRFIVETDELSLSLPSDSA